MKYGIVLVGRDVMCLAPPIPRHPVCKSNNNSHSVRDKTEIYYLGKPKNQNQMVSPFFPAVLLYLSVGLVAVLWYSLNAFLAFSLKLSARKLNY